MFLDEKTRMLSSTILFRGIGVAVIVISLALFRGIGVAVAVISLAEQQEN